MNDPRICFLDEPTTGLDPHARRAIWEVIRKLRDEGRTVFLTTHYLEEAQLLADRVAIIHHGQIIAEGRPAEIIRTHGGPARLVISGGVPVAEFFRSREGVHPTIRDGHVEIPIQTKEEGLGYLDALRSSGIPWDGFTVEQDTLEDVFIRLVGRMDDGVLKSEAAHERTADRGRSQ
ncbi:ABC transporter ATP binding protein, partial [mine drainage metagenome]